MSVYQEAIIKPHDNDVLCGRGGGTNHHRGNKRFRTMIEKSKQQYRKIKKFDKKRLAEKVIERIRNLSPPGRFLKKDKVTKLWVEIDGAFVIKKTSQAFRERKNETGDPPAEGGEEKKVDPPLEDEQPVAAPEVPYPNLTHNNNMIRRSTSNGSLGIQAPSRSLSNCSDYDLLQQADNTTMDGAVHREPGRMANMPHNPNNKEVIHDEDHSRVPCPLEDNTMATDNSLEGTFYDEKNDFFDDMPLGFLVCDSPEQYSHDTEGFEDQKMSATTSTYACNDQDIPEACMVGQTGGSEENIEVETESTSFHNHNEPASQMNQHDQYLVASPRLDRSVSPLPLGCALAHSAYNDLQVAGFTDYAAAGSMVGLAPPLEHADVLEVTAEMPDEKQEDSTAPYEDIAGAFVAVPENNRQLLDPASQETSPASGDNDSFRVMNDDTPDATFEKSIVEYYMNAEQREQSPSFMDDIIFEDDAAPRLIAGQCTCDQPRDQIEDAALTKEVNESAAYGLQEDTTTEGGTAAAEAVPIAIAEPLETLGELSRELPGDGTNN